MNLSDSKYQAFTLCKEMLETCDIVRHFDVAGQAEIGKRVADVGRVFLTGEGSSRIFPAKNTIQYSRRAGASIELHTEAGRQATDYDLDNWTVFAASNSGQTAEVIRLFKKLDTADHENRFSLSAKADSPLEKLASEGFVLNCGKETAVAATKSVVEQALFYRSVIDHAIGGNRASSLQSRLGELADAINVALTDEIDSSLINTIKDAGTIYWSGRNDGVAEELTLKTNEITRKKSDFMEGTYAVHGIEEVMDPTDVVLWVDPYEESEAKFQEVLADSERGVGLSIIAIASRDTSFPTIRIPDCGDLNEFVQLAAGWNVLVEVGLALGIDLDKPERARKVGNMHEGD